MNPVLLMVSKPRLSIPRARDKNRRASAAASAPPWRRPPPPPAPGPPAPAPGPLPQLWTGTGEAERLERLERVVVGPTKCVDCDSEWPTNPHPNGLSSPGCSLRSGLRKALGPPPAVAPAWGRTQRQRQRPPDRDDPSRCIEGPSGSKFQHRETKGNP